MQRIRYILGVLIGGALLLIIPQTSSAQERGVEFKLALNTDNETYEVYMRPTHTFGDLTATTTAQVAIKAPHGTGDTRFEVADLVSAVAGTSWERTSRYDAPEESPSTDYIEFTVEFPLGTDPLVWTAGEEFMVFSFKNANFCEEGTALSLMASDDSFAPPNSVSSNSGNWINVLDLSTADEYQYIGNYGAAEVPCQPITRNPDPGPFQIRLPVIRR